MPDLEDDQSPIPGIKESVDQPNFFSRVFRLMSKKTKQDLNVEKDSVESICVEAYAEFSLRIDRSKVQDSCSVRNVLQSRQLAIVLIDDQGELNAPVLARAVDCLQRNLYFCGPDRQYDVKRRQHMLKVLRSLQEKKELQRLLKFIGKPHSNLHAEEIIRDTLQLPAATLVNDAHARRAALAAWLCYLRQNVGSCFATAPAIVVHDEQPELMLTDINELLSTGRLKRTFSGIEYSVPLSNSWGVGDLKKPFYLSSPMPHQIGEIWHSPSLLAALESAGALSGPESNKEKALRIKKLIFDLFKLEENKYNVLLSTPEEVMSRILLHFNALTDKDIRDFVNRPAVMSGQGMLPGMSPVVILAGNALSKVKKSKAEACAYFLKQMADAKKTFKIMGDNALLKAWEFSLASFAETKSDFARWNLYSSLGLRHDEPGGIGEGLYAIIKRKMEECNQQVHELQAEYEQVYAQLKYAEGRLKQASSEKEAHWLRSEYQVRANEFRTLEEMRDSMHARAKVYAGLFDLLINIYDSKFPEYFQEVYDAEMHDVVVGPYDDSPAGFRLLYKHGRSNSSQWTMIYTYQEFIDALVSFFIATETDLRTDPDLHALEEDISEIVTAVVNHIRTPEFIESAFARMAAAHHVAVVKNPLENLDKIEKKPWVYTSGGNMGTLVSCYYRRDQKPTEVERWVENEVELLVFMIDSLKQIPHKMLQEFIQPPFKTMLMHSPTHAFLLKPASAFIKEGILSETFTYTWVRDNLVIPRQRFVDNILLDESMVRFFYSSLCEMLPVQAHILFNKTFFYVPINMRPNELRQYILDTISGDRGLLSAFSLISLKDELDSLLYTSLPMFPSYQLKDRLEKIFEAIPQISLEKREKLLYLLDAFSGTHPRADVISSKFLQDTAKALLCAEAGSAVLPEDEHQLVSQAVQQLGYAMPAPVIFADTNWVKDEFGFVVNPGTGRFELWRLDLFGSVGYPMSMWRQWLNGSHRDRTWGIYTRPYEYEGSSQMPADKRKSGGGGMQSLRIM